MRRRTPVAVACLVAALSCASPGPRPRLAVDLDGWHEIRLGQVSVLGSVSVDSLRELAEELASFEALVRHVTNARIDRSAPIRIYVFRSEEEAKRFIPDFAAGAMFEALPGYFAFLGDEDPQYWTRQVLLHEYTHAILRSGRRVAYPRWYDEGMAEFLASARFREDAVIVGATLTGRLRDLERFGRLPLEDLFEDELGERTDIFRFYATAWALVHLLNSSSDGRARLLAFVSRLTRGEDWRTAYAASFDRSLPELQAALDAHVARLRGGLRLDFHLARESLRPAEPPVETAVPSAEIAYQLGSAMRQRWEESADEDSLATARALFEQALERDSGHARARAALAWLHEREGDGDGSAALLSRAQDEAPDDPVVALEVGRIAALRAAQPGAPAGAARAARTALELAVRLDPARPESHAALARQLRAAGDLPAAIAAYERARELGAWSPPLDLELARSYLDAGAPGRAVALLRPLAAGEHRGRVTQEARRLLDQLTLAHGGSPDPAAPPDEPRS